MSGECEGPGHVVPVAAATVVLIRDGSGGLETLLVRRSSSLAFHGGAWVFPGGRIDPDDYACGGAPRDASHPAHEQAAHRAAVREAREEAGLDCDELSLVPFSHWTTPPGGSKRFATWFFLAAAPAGAVSTDGVEITEHSWRRPADALRDHAAKVIELPPPTYVSLCRLTGSATVEEALIEARTAPYVRFEPRVHRVESGFVWLYPGDVAYSGAAPLDAPGSRHRLWGLTSSWRYERRMT